VHERLASAKKGAPSDLAHIRKELRPHKVISQASIYIIVRVLKSIAFQ